MIEIGCDRKSFKLKLMIIMMALPDQLVTVVVLENKIVIINGSVAQR